MATLKDVAKLACVDASTVSRALNNTSYVHPETKSRIYAAVQALSYQPNVLAQGLRHGKRHTIGMVFPSLNMTIFAELAQSIEQEACRSSYATIICTTEDDPAVERECLNRLRNGFVDGLIVAGTGKNNRLLRDIQSSGVAVTQIIRQQEKTISCVVSDYEACGYDGVQYLYEKGCREIGLINGDTNLRPYRDRYAGYCRALEEFGLTNLTASARCQNNSFEYGYQCAEKLLSKAHKLDAIMAAVDIQGLGAIRALKDHHIRIPEDVRLISLTGHSIGKLLETSMTALELPAMEMGINATKLVIKQCEQPPEEKLEIENLVFPAVLVEREST